MARPWEFDGEYADTIARCIGKQGYEATSIKDLVSLRGVTGHPPQRAHLSEGIGPLRRGERWRQNRVLGATSCRAIEIFEEIVKCSLSDRDRSMLLNAASDIATPTSSSLRS